MSRLNLKTAEMRYKVRSSMYVKCKKCGDYTSSREDVCIRCRRDPCRECGRMAKLIGGRICRLCMNKRGKE